MLKILGKDIFFLNLLFPKSLTFSYSNSVFLSPFFDHSLFHEPNEIKKCMVGGGGGIALVIEGQMITTLDRVIFGSEFER